MPDHRDVAAFDERAGGYERGWLGRLHHRIAERVAAVALSVRPSPVRILDVGCGTGYFLRVMMSRCPDAIELVGIDAAPAMVVAATALMNDARVRVEVGLAERLPHADRAFDLIVSTTSFDHWADQVAGVAECARVLAPGGHLVIADLFSPLLIPTLIGGRRTKARTKRRAERLLLTTGLGAIEWYTVVPLIQAVVATRQLTSPTPRAD